jgi:hypothetical protein
MGFFSALFGGGKDRSQYDRQVDTILTNDFQIQIDSVKNPRFPGILKYRQMVDEVWAGDGTPEASALRVALPYYGGLAKSDVLANRTDAAALLPRIQRLMREYLTSGAIKQDRFDYYANVLLKYTGKSV